MEDFVSGTFDPKLYPYDSPVFVSLLSSVSRPPYTITSPPDPRVCPISGTVTGIRFKGPEVFLEVFRKFLVKVEI